MKSIVGRAGWAVSATLALAIVAMVARGASGGPLDPPGPPQSTDGVRDAGTPITSIPYTITQPGYYYLTRSLTSPGSGQNGITVNAQDVTVNLRGFELIGVGQTGTGLLAAAADAGLQVAHGSIRNWGIGVNGSAESWARYSDLRILGNDLGIAVVSATVEDCTISGNNGGISAGTSIVRRCQIDDNHGNGMSLTQNTLVEDNEIDFNGLFIAGSWQIAVVGDDNAIRDNYVRSDASAPFMGVFPGVKRNLAVNNRYNCSSPIVNNSGDATNLVLPTSNYCM